MIVLRTLARLGRLALLLAGDGTGAWRTCRRLGFAAAALAVAWMMGRACRLW